MLLARLRLNGDIKRSEIRDLILESIAEKLLSPSVAPRLIKLFTTFHDSVQTDISPVEVGKMACLVTHLNTEKIEFVSFPESLFKSTRVQDPVLGNTPIYAADFDVLKTYVKKFENGVGFDTVENVIEEVVSP